MTILKENIYGATNLVKNSNKSKCVYRGNRIGLDRAGSWSFCYKFVRNAAIFGVDNSSSSHTDNQLWYLIIIKFR